MDGGEAPGPSLGALVPALREIGDLKRVTSAGRDGTLATRLFREAWARLVAGEDPRAACAATVASALAAARLGDLDAAALGAAGLGPDEVAAVRRAAYDQLAPSFPLASETFVGGLRASPAPGGVALPPFVAALEAQPRAGVTCPGKPRLLFPCPESHAEHCLVTAVYGALLAPRHAADPATVFVAGLAHHLHNALLPDSGFTGEVLLGDRLLPAFAEATRQALAQLAPPLRALVEGARACLPDAATPEGRAFHAADTLDRVLQIAWHLQAGRTTMREVLVDMELVHDGPVKRFQDGLLAEAGLLPA